jgi:hypothetical protein
MFREAEIFHGKVTIIAPVSEQRYGRGWRD